MAGNVSQDTAPRNRYIPRGHALSWWMLVITTGAILITSIDRALLPTVLPGILGEFDLSETAGGVLAAVCLLTLAPISMIRETVAEQEPSLLPQEA